MNKALITWTMQDAYWNYFYLSAYQSEIRAVTVFSNHLKKFPQKWSLMDHKNPSKDIFVIILELCLFLRLL